VAQVCADVTTGCGEDLQETRVGRPAEVLLPRPTPVRRFAVLVGVCCRATERTCSRRGRPGTRLNRSLVSTPKSRERVLSHLGGRRIAYCSAPPFGIEKVPTIRVNSTVVGEPSTSSISWALVPV
jgi:hypothetical protein